MEVPVNSKSESSTLLFPLNYDCMFEIYKWLGFRECMNLAEAYDDLQSIADGMYKSKFSKFTFDFSDSVEQVFHHIGPFVSSLTLVLDNFNYTEEDLRNIQYACKELQSVTLNGFSKRAIKNIPFSDVAENLEMLSLTRCSLANDGDFFQTFRNLKYLNIDRCRDYNNSVMSTCFENNPGITSFTCDAQFLYYTKLLQLLPNLERLSLHYTYRTELKLLSQMNALRNLTLHCWGTNVDNVLTDLGTTNILEQLELNHVDIGQNTFDRINSFQNLQLLVITASNKNIEFNASHLLPKKLKILKLGRFKISLLQITSLIKQLPHIENIHLADCIVDDNGALISDFDAICNLIGQSFNSNQQLNLVLSTFRDNSNEKIVSVGRMQIFNYLAKQSVFQICYPGAVVEVM